MLHQSDYCQISDSYLFCEFPGSISFFNLTFSTLKARTSRVALVVNNLPASAGDVGSAPGLGRSPG